LFFEQLNVRKPDYFLEAVKGTASETIGDIIAKADKIIVKIKPDALLIYGDTNSCLSVIAAKKRKIPIFHMEAGNRCFDQRVPEEINRKIVDHISDINLTYSNFAKDNLIQEGLNKNNIIKIGSPLREVINTNLNEILSNKILKKLKLEKEKYFLFSFHREENVDDENQLKNFVNVINKLAKKNKEKIVLTLHPRTKKNLKIHKFKMDKKIIINKPFGYFEYINLQLNAKVTLSDSGSIPEEASILGLKAICLRDTHERQESSSEPSVVMSELDYNQLNTAIKTLVKSKKNSKIISDYAEENISQKIPKIIIGYTSIINKKVWKKNI
jgi:UDP-N-acetylglucosamine 2-epimerase (non-hydrolysing)